MATSSNWAAVALRRAGCSKILSLFSRNRHRIAGFSRLTGGDSTVNSQEAFPLRSATEITKPQLLSAAQNSNAINPLTSIRTRSLKTSSQSHKLINQSNGNIRRHTFRKPNIATLHHRRAETSKSMTLHAMEESEIYGRSQANKPFTEFKRFYATKGSKDGKGPGNKDPKDPKNAKSPATSKTAEDSKKKKSRRCLKIAQSTAPAKAAAGAKDKKDAKSACKTPKPAAAGAKDKKDAKSACKTPKPAAAAAKDKKDAKSACKTPKPPKGVAKKQQPKAAPKTDSKCTKSPSKTSQTAKAAPKKDSKCTKSPSKTSQTAKGPKGPCADKPGAGAAKAKTPKKEKPAKIPCHRIEAEKKDSKSKCKPKPSKCPKTIKEMKLSQMKSKENPYEMISFGNVLLDSAASMDSSKTGVLKKFKIKPHSKGELPADVIAKLQGEVCKLEKCMENPGGSALNTNRFLQQLGIKTLFVGSVGQDKEAKKLRDLLRKAEVDASLMESKSPTGKCVSVINKETNEETLYANVGASANLNVDYLKLIEANKDCPFLRQSMQPQIIYIEGFFLPHHKKVCEYILKNYLKDKRFLAFNLSAEYIINTECEQVLTLAKKAFLIFGNYMEFMALSKVVGISCVGETVSALMTHSIDIPKTIVVTDKEKVSLVTNFVSMCSPPGDIKKLTLTPKKATKIVDPTGAGDGFVAGFLYGFLKKRPMEDCVKMGSEVATKVIAEIGANLPKGFKLGPTKPKPKPKPKSKPKKKSKGGKGKGKGKGKAKQCKSKGKDKGKGKGQGKGKAKGKGKGKGDGKGKGNGCKK